MRCNENGDSLWTKSINYNNLVINSSNDGGYYSYYMDNLTKFDSSMNKEWDFTLYMLIDLIIDVSQSSDSTFFVLGAKDTIFTGSPGIKHLYKLDKNGNQLLEKYYYGDYAIRNIQATEDGGAIIYAVVNDSSNYRFLMLMKIDANGDSLWSRDYKNLRLSPSNGIDPIVSLPNGDLGFLANIGYVSYPYLAKIDSVGNILSIDSFASYSTLILNIHAGIDGSLFGIGSTLTSNNKNIQLLFRQYNPDNFLDYQIGDLSDEQGLFIYQTSDSGYYMVAQRDSSTQKEILLLKNSPGHGFLYSVNEIASNLTATISPNPNSGHFTISLAEQSACVDITITNTLGQEVCREKYYNTSLIELELQGRSGIYFVSIVDGGRSGVFRVVKW